MKARVYVVLKEGILDPQGKAVQQSLHALGFEGVQEVRVGKFFEIVLSAVSRDQADMAIRAMCDKLLSNPIIDNYRYEIIE